MRSMSSGVTMCRSSSVACWTRTAAGGGGYTSFSSRKTIFSSASATRFSSTCRLMSVITRGKETSLGIAPRTGGGRFSSQRGDLFGERGHLVFQFGEPPPEAFLDQVQLGAAQDHLH